LFGELEGVWLQVHKYLLDSHLISFHDVV
jgi:hypothetical protein